MTAYTLRQIAKALDISRSRVEQWISRGHFRTPDRPIFGTARDWDFGDVMRLAVFGRLIEAEISPASAGILTQIGFNGFEDDEAFFIAWQGWHVIPIRDKAGKAQRTLAPGMWSSDTVRGRDLGAFLTQPALTVSIVINLDAIERGVKSALEIKEQT